MAAAVHGTWCPNPIAWLGGRVGSNQGHELRPGFRGRTVFPRLCRVEALELESSGRAQILG